MSPLSVARAPHYIKEVELGHSHFFLGWQHMESGRVSRIWYGTKNVLKGSVRLSYCLAFCLLTTVAKVSQLSSQRWSALSFHSV